MEISILLENENNGIYTVTYKYWTKGECACSAIKKTASFGFKPSKQDLIDSI